MLFSRFAAQDFQNPARRALLGWFGRGYTTAEVAAQLRAGAAATTDPARSRAILACAARSSEWLSRIDGGTLWRLGRLTAGRLPSVVFWYRAGLSLEEIGERISVFGGPWLAGRALEAASRCIASRLNDRRLPTLE